MNSASFYTQAMLYDRDVRLQNSVFSKAAQKISNNKKIGGQVCSNERVHPHHLVTVVGKNFGSVSIIRHSLTIIFLPVFQGN